MKKITLAIVFLFAGQLVFAGGPWPQKKGGFYIKLSEWWTVFDQHYTDQGFLDPNVTTSIFNTTLYAEYGLSDRFTATINTPLLSRNIVNNVRSATTSEVIFEGDALNSFGDIDFSLKYGLTKPGAKFPISASLTLGIPTGVAQGGLQDNLQTGDGEFNQILQVHAGTGFNIGNLSAYASTYIGYNNRTQGFSEELRGGLELGLGLFQNKLWLNSRLNIVESLKNGDTAATTTSTSIFANNSEFTSLGFEANLYLSKNFGVSAGVASALRGEIIAAAPAYNVGVFIDLK